jgi:hypothetical protein
MDHSVGFELIRPGRSGDAREEPPTASMSRRTIAELIVAVDARTDLAAREKGRAKSGLRAFAEAIALIDDPGLRRLPRGRRRSVSCDRVLTDPAWLNERLRKLKPELAGLKKRTFAATLSRARSDLAWVGAIDSHRTLEVPPDSEWGALLAAIGDPLL